MNFLGFFCYDTLYVLGLFKMDGDEIQLLEAELVKLTVRSSKILSDKNPTLLCTVWTRKTFNPESLRAQMLSI